ncbi:hypothetical protein KVR01_010480 [Diaporthe batatas]|uniref:uncharacterized protein n=1 Tax=Diaporthe batatas TaxID=748121 RepID=UPI001D04510B|nr:uncharacterized protein KVR01_010480 [Diaporthe batatas]KAG8159843.1 hypothetical protein KVR01_010480 [Diaporthe batatas]
MEALSKQLILSTQSGRLKPDVRLGVAISEFAQSLGEDRKREFQKMQTSSTQLCGRDAIRVTEELNRDSERRYQNRQPCGTKCGKFLDRLQTLANIGDIAVGGSQNIIATSVWCAVRLSLQAATNFRSYFERLSNLFMKLGTSWELHNEFSQIFPQSEALQTFLCEYLIVLMRLCRKAVIFSNKSLGGQLWSSLGASFESEFRPLQEEMDKWGLMIQHKTQQLATTHVVDAEMFRRRDYKQRILNRLSPNQSQHITTWRRHRRKGDCKWIYQTEAYKSWIAENTSSALCISGKLGSGKTVSMANLVAQLNMHQTCAFFFCDFKEQESLKATTVMGSMAFHFLDSIPGNDPAWDTLSRQEDARASLFATSEIIGLLNELLPVDKKLSIVLDGLEDCPDDEIAEIVSGLHRLMSSRNILLCYSARSGSVFRRVTSPKLGVDFSVSLENNLHDEEMKMYITEEVARRQQISQAGLFSDELVELIKKQLLAGAQGMYLWVALQLESIFPSNPRTIVTHEQALNLINNLPKDLPETFERALEKVFDHRYGNTMMKIVTAAPSSLTLDEIKVALAVVPGEPVWYAAKVPSNSAQLVALCGGNLLELDEEDGKVRFIHYSVVGHFLQPTENPRTMLYHFTIQEAEILSSAICITYLSMSISETAVTLPRHIDGSKLSEKIIGTAAYDQPLVARLVHHFKKKDSESSSAAELEIGRLLAEIQATRLPDFDPHCFRGCAASNWLHHSRSFERQNPLCDSVWHLWMGLLCGNVAIAKPPFQNFMVESSRALSWAIEHHHGALIRAILNEPATEPQDPQTFAEEVLANLINYDSYGSYLGSLLVHLLHLIAITLLRVDERGQDEPWLLPFQVLHKLLDCGADASTPHAKNGKHVLKMLLELLGHIREHSSVGCQLSELTERVLTLPNVLSLIRSDWVPYALRTILEIGNIRIFKILLTFRPELRMPAEEISLVGIAVAQQDIELVKMLVVLLPDGGDCLGPLGTPGTSGMPAIQLALQNQNVEMMQLLANHGGLNKSDVELHLGPAIIYFKASRPETRRGLVRPSYAFLEACKTLADDLSQDQIFEYFRVDKLERTSKRGKTRRILLELAKATPPDQLKAQCPKGNTALHYLTGGIAEFNSEALQVARHLLRIDSVRSGPATKNKAGQTPLRRAIDRASLSGWTIPYDFSPSFLAIRICLGVVSDDELTGDEDSILGFAIVKGAPLDPVIRSIIHVGANMNGVLNGATPLEIAFALPDVGCAAQIVFCLLAHGADPSLKFSNGSSLLDTMTPINRRWLINQVSRSITQRPCQNGRACYQDGSAILALERMIQMTRIND